jgi:hypothetical protein
MSLAGESRPTVPSANRKPDDFPSPPRWNLPPGMSQDPNEAGFINVLLILLTFWRSSP